MEQVLGSAMDCSEMASNRRIGFFLSQLSLSWLPQMPVPTKCPSNCALLECTHYCITSTSTPRQFGHDGHVIIRARLIAALYKTGIFRNSYRIVLVAIVVFTGIAHTCLHRLH